MNEDIRIEELPRGGVIVEVTVSKGQNTLEILREAARKLQVEVLRYETRARRGLDW